MRHIENWKAGELCRCRAKTLKLSLSGILILAFTAFAPNPTFAEMIDEICATFGS